MIYNKTKENPPTLPYRNHTGQTVYPVLKSETIEEIIKSDCGNVYVCDKFGNGRHTVFVLPEAYSQLVSMISYGRRSPMNVKEQKFIGLGHFFDGADGCVNIVISHFIQIFTTNRTGISAENLGPDGEHNPGLDFLNYYREEFLEYEKKCNTDAFGKPADPFLKYGASEYVLEGHTHPDLGVFWSSTDRKSGKARAAKKPVCIFVCDPVRKQMLGCVGSEFENATILAFSRAQNVTSYALDKEKSKNKDVEKTKEPEKYKAEKELTLQHGSDGFDGLCAAAGAYLTKHGYSGKLKCRKNLKGERVITFKMTAKGGKK